MSADRAVRRLDADSAERLLAGEQVGFAELSALLAAAAAPARPHELTGETAAVVVFRHATLDATTVRLRRRSTARVRWARLASVKAAAAAVALATAGVALAAGTGMLPTYFTPGPSTASPSRAAGPGGLGPDRSGTASTAAVPTTPTVGSQNPSASTTPDPELVRLCRRYQDKAKEDPGKALDGPGFKKLIEAAGGRDKVEGYCDLLLAREPGRPSGPPTGGATPRKPTHTPHG